MRKLMLTGLLVAGLGTGLVVMAQLADAGPLTPPGRPSPTSVTLNELGEKLERIEASKFKPAELPSAGEYATAGAVLLTVEGAVSGMIEGGVASTGQEGAIYVLGFSHEVVSPRDSATGLPTGKRQHRPLTIIKPIDKSSPLLMNALTTNENLVECKVKFFQRNATGEIEQYYTITLENATIVSLVSEVPNFESVSFVYESITWTYEDGGITAEDDWQTPDV